MSRMSFFTPKARPAAEPQSDGPREPTRRRRILIAWLIVVAWAGVIWTLGGDGFSAGETSGWFSSILNAIGIEITPGQRYRMAIFIRKSAHFVEYGILAVLAFRAALLSAGRNQIATAAWTALFLVATLATADEARQAFLASRTGSPIDVMIDITGGSLAVIGIIWVMRRVRNSAAPQPETAP